MASQIETAVLLLAAVGSGLVGGVFFAFSAFVMRALADLPAGTGIAAMQRINVVVLGPWFLGLFVGTALLGLACIGLAVSAPGTMRSWLQLGAGLVYTLGAFGVTVAFNVPRNAHLARLAPESPAAQAYWPDTCASGWLGIISARSPRAQRRYSRPLRWRRDPIDCR